MTFKTFGIIGYGHFGRFLAGSLASRGDVLVTDVDTAKLPENANGVRAASIEEIGAADVAIIAVPFAALEGALEELRDRLPEDTLVMDVVSTKARATELLETILAEHPNVLATHPLFGPPSMEEMQSGQRLVVTRQRGQRAADFQQYLREEFGLEIVELSADDHDRAMAYMQSLPFFIARALVNIDIDEWAHRETLALPSFRKLAEIAAIEEEHSVEMFDTSQISNPYADEARSHFLKVLGELQEEIGRHALAAEAEGDVAKSTITPAQQ